MKTDGCVEVGRLVEPGNSIFSLGCDKKGHFVWCFCIIKGTYIMIIFSRPGRSQGPALQSPPSLIN